MGIFCAGGAGEDKKDCNPGVQSSGIFGCGQRDNSTPDDFLPYTDVLSDQVISIPANKEMGMHIRLNNAGTICNQGTISIDK